MRIKVSRFILVVMGVIAVNMALIISVSGVDTARKKDQEFSSITLKEGDLVFRNGYGMISSWFQRCSLRDPSFSHAGIVVFKEDQPFVVHLQQSNYGSPLKCERISEFWSKEICSKGAVYRPDVSALEIDNIVEDVKNDLKNIPEFDYEFNMEDNSKFYCSEWIRDKFINATGDVNYFPVTSLENFSYIAPDNLYLNQHSTFIYRFNYP
ncbi:MAG: hypothetical protein IPJ86_12550 [Bacteroidetes bacterium]|jgi:hypothetical protein|nr:hypothetical protein [Bacteroidota bacterium]